MTQSDSTQQRRLLKQIKDKNQSKMPLLNFQQQRHFAQQYSFTQYCAHNQTCHVFSNQSGAGGTLYYSARISLHLNYLKGNGTHTATYPNTHQGQTGGLNLHLACS